MDNEDWRIVWKLNDDGSLTMLNREIGLQQTFERHDFGPEVMAELNRERDNLDSLESDGWRPSSSAGAMLDDSGGLAESGAVAMDDTFGYKDYEVPKRKRFILPYPSNVVLSRLEDFCANPGFVTYIGEQVPLPSHKPPPADISEPFSLAGFWVKLVPNGESTTEVVLINAQGLGNIYSVRLVEWLEKMEGTNGKQAKTAENVISTAVDLTTESDVPKGAMEKVQGEWAVIGTHKQLERIVDVFGFEEAKAAGRDPIKGSRYSGGGSFYFIFAIDGNERYLSVKGQIWLYDIPDRVLLKFYATDENWPLLKESWELLLAELDRLGFNPQPVASNGQPETAITSLVGDREDRINKAVNSIPDNGWDRMALRMWWSGYTNGEIAQKVDVINNRSVTNRLSHLRKIYGEEIVPTNEQRKKFMRKNDMT